MTLTSVCVAAASTSCVANRIIERLDGGIGIVDGHVAEIQTLIEILEKKSLLVTLKKSEKSMR
jgi:hypothetical protein